jgi:hypothetical protein
MVANVQFFKPGKPLKAWGVLIFDKNADEAKTSKRKAKLDISS